MENTVPLSTVQDPHQQALTNLRDRPKQLSLDDAITLYKMVMPEHISVSREGIFHLKANEKKVLISNTLFIPIMKINNEYLLESKESICIQGFNKNNVLKTVELSINQFFKGKWIQEVGGFEIVLGKNKANSQRLIIELTQKLYQYCDIYFRYHYIGWNNLDSSATNNMVYVTANKLLGKEKTSIKIIPNDKLSHFTMSINEVDYDYKPNYLFVLNDMLDVAPHDVTYTALSFQILSLLVSKLNTYPSRPSFIYYLHGKSGSRKTTIAKLIFNIFDGYENQVPINFTATTAAMQQMMNTFRDTTLLIDDIAPAVSKTESNSQKEKLELLIRSSGDNIGKLKHNKLEATPSALFAVTAEDNIIESQSSLVRSFIVEINKDDVNLEKLTLSQNNKIKYSSFITHFIDQLTMHQLDALLQNFRKNMVIFRDIGDFESPHGRSVEIAAWLMSGFELFMNYGIRNRLIFPDEFNNRLKEMERILANWIRNISNKTSYITSVTMMNNAIKELISSNQYGLCKLVKEGKKQTFIPIRAKIIGYRDDHYVYFLPEVLYQAVTSFYSRSDTAFHISQRQLFKALDEVGLIEGDNNSDNTKTVRITINKMRVSVLRLNKEEFMKYNIDLLGSLASNGSFFSL